MTDPIKLTPLADLPDPADPSNPYKLDPDIFAVSTRIREYEAAAHALEGLARLSSDRQVCSALRQSAGMCINTADHWRRWQTEQYAASKGKQTATNEAFADVADAYERVVRKAGNPHGGNRGT